MITFEFEYKSVKTIIQSIYEDKMGQVCFKFAQKIQIDLNKLYFIYSGSIVNLDLSVKQIINKIDKGRKILSIIAIDYLDEQGNNSKIISPYVICPICKEHARFDIKNYRIKIYNCKNKHVVDDILFKDFEKTQTIDESLIIFYNCKKNNKSNTYNKEMYICNKCNMNLCPLCKSNHDKNHKIINYEQKYYICNVHNKEYISYCETCNKDICLLCKKDHKNHDITPYDDIVPENINKEEIKSGIHIIRTTINSKLEIIIDRLNNVKKTLETYLKFVENNLLNFNINNINYNILQNINYNYKNGEPNFETIYQDVRSMMRDNTYKEFIPTILKMYNEMNKNEIDIIYNIPNNENSVKIFGKEFVKINKDLCKIIYDNKEYNIAEKFDCKNIKENILKFKLIRN